MNSDKVIILILVIFVALYVISQYISAPSYKTNIHEDIKTNDTNYYIANSNIHGKGVFVNKEYKPGEYIGFAFTEVGDNVKHAEFNKPFATMINHSNNANSELVMFDDKAYVMASVHIPKNTEITINYNKTPDYIKNADSSWK